MHFVNHENGSSIPVEAVESILPTEGGGYSVIVKATRQLLTDLELVHETVVPNANPNLVLITENLQVNVTDPDSILETPILGWCVDLLDTIQHALPVTYNCAAYTPGAQILDRNTGMLMGVTDHKRQSYADYKKDFRKRATPRLARDVHALIAKGMSEFEARRAVGALQEPLTPDAGSSQNH